MKKSIKRYLSYMLGIVLACGLGLTYAYAVGANDSNAFLTSSEWNAKVTQLETTLDSINDQIDDSNMDFVMSGPRLQQSFMEGLENSGSLATALTGEFKTNHIYAKSNSDGSVNYGNLYTIVDLQDGRQALRPIGIESGTNGSITWGRYALKTTTPNKYIVISSIRAENNNDLYFVERYEVGDGVYNYANSETLTVELNSNEWKTTRGTAISSCTRTAFGGLLLSANVFTPDTYDPFDGNSSYKDNAMYMTIETSGNTLKYTFEFSSDISLGYVARGNLNSFPWPLNINGKLLATQGDHLIPRTKSYDFVAKVWSPIKNCYCLKNLADGEIPILNE